MAQSLGVSEFKCIAQKCAKQRRTMARWINSQLSGRKRRREGELGSLSKFCTFIIVKSPAKEKGKKNIITGICKTKMWTLCILPRMNFLCGQQQESTFWSHSTGAGHKHALCWRCFGFSCICLMFSVVSDNIREKRNKSDHTVPIMSCCSEVNLDFPS